MLKFSGFADLTSCLWKGQGRQATQPPPDDSATVGREAERADKLFKLTQNTRLGTLNTSDWVGKPPTPKTRGRVLGIGPDVQILSNRTEGSWNKKTDTEAGMLSGISRKHSIRSNPYWFTEFCNSQCLSHFAAPFIVVRAETSVAESCVQ